MIFDFFKTIIYKLNYYLLIVTNLKNVFRFYDNLLALPLNLGRFCKNSVRF